MNDTATPTKATPAVSKASAGKAAPVKKVPAKKAPAKPPAKKATPAKKVAAKKAPAAPKVMASSDKNHQDWKLLKRELTAVMSDLLYDSRRVTPDHSKSREEATAKVTSALKVLSEFTSSIRIK